MFFDTPTRTKYAVILSGDHRTVHSDGTTQDAMLADILRLLICRVRLHMPLQVAYLAKVFSTLRTSMWLFISKKQQVKSQICQAAKLLIAMRAAVCLCTGMYGYVPGNAASVIKHFTTVWTCACILSGMDRNVTLHRKISTELLKTKDRSAAFRRNVPPCASPVYICRYTFYRNADNHKTWRGCASTCGDSCYHAY